MQINAGDHVLQIQGVSIVDVEDIHRVQVKEGGVLCNVWLHATVKAVSPCCDCNDVDLEQFLVL